jgi:hypothetical protein
MNRARTVAAIALIIVALPSAAAGHLSQYTYASGSSQPYSVFPGSEAWNHRDYNQVWHQAGNTWGVFYVTTDRIIHAWVRDTSNPTRWGGEIGYATPKCENVNDTSGVTFTCQSTGG